MRKLPVFASISEVLSGVSRHYFQLLIAAWPAVLLLAAIGGILAWLVPFAEGLGVTFAGNEQADKEALKVVLTSWSIMAACFGILILFFVASAIAAVRWHRLVLFGEGAGGHLGQVRPIRSEDGRYIWTMIKIWLIVGGAFVAMVLIVMLPSFLSPGRKADWGALNLIIYPLFIVGFFWLAVSQFRFLLALPDAAIGRGGRVFAVFSATAGNTWRLFALGLLLSLISGFGLGFVEGLFRILARPGGEGSGVGHAPFADIVGAVVYIAVYLYFLMTQITMLSVAYREIIGLPGDASPADVETGPVERIEPV